MYYRTFHAKITNASMTTVETKVADYNGGDFTHGPEGEEITEKVFDPGYLPSLTEINSIGEFAMTSLHFQRMYGGGEPIFEHITREYINALSDYLAQRVRVYSRDKSPILIVETGTGNGKLSHFLRQRLDESVSGLFELIATDSVKMGLIQYFPIETLDYREALKKYEPAIVITSWMPRRQDWTREYRATPSVREYILTGEAFETCGADSVWEENIYRKDGFTGQELKRVTLGQASFPGHRTSTHVFKRVNSV